MRPTRSWRRPPTASPRGTTLMLPTEDADVVGAELTRRFGLAHWQFTLSATDANRTALRIARHVTGRDKVLCFSYSYHGGVDETFAVAGPGGATVAREHNVGPPVDVALTTRAIEFNDVDALRDALAPGDVACVIAEPAMTNMGIILPEPGYHEQLRALTREAGTLLMIDETHTFSAGPRGATARLRPRARHAHDRQGDRRRRARRCAGAPRRARRPAASATPSADLEDTGGIGGTLAGNALSLAAMRAALTHVLTEEGFARAQRGVRPRARGHRGRDRRARPAVARGAARHPRRVPLHRRRRRRTGPRRAGASTSASSASCTCTR